MLTALLAFTPYALVVAIPGWLVFWWRYRRLQSAETPHLRGLKIRFGGVLFLWWIATLLFCGAAVAGAVGLGHGGSGEGVGMVVLALVGSYAGVGGLLLVWLGGSVLGWAMIVALLGGPPLYTLLTAPLWVCEPIAEAGVGWANLCVGKLYESGRGGALNPNRSRAIEAYIAAGADGYPSAAKRAAELLPVRNPRRIAVLESMLESRDRGFAAYEIHRTLSLRSESGDEVARSDAMLEFAAEARYGPALRDWLRRQHPDALRCRAGPEAAAVLPSMEALADAYERGWSGQAADANAASRIREKRDCLQGEIKRWSADIASISESIAALRAPDASAAANAIQRLSGLGPHAAEACPELLQLAKARQSSLAWASLNALHEICPDDEGIVGALGQMLVAANPYERGNGARGVGGFAEKLPEAFPRLVEMLDDPVPSVRGEAALALTHFGPRAVEALPAIEHAMAKTRDSIAASYLRQSKQKIRKAAREGE